VANDTSDHLVSTTDAGLGLGQLDLSDNGSHTLEVADVDNKTPVVHRVFATSLRSLCAERVPVVAGVLADGLLLVIVSIVNFAVNGVVERLHLKGIELKFVVLLQETFAITTCVLAIIYTGYDLLREVVALRSKGLSRTTTDNVSRSAINQPSGAATGGRFPIATGVQQSAAPTLGAMPGEGGNGDRAGLTGRGPRRLLWWRVREPSS
jgi:hypothetical protein